MTETKAKTVIQNEPNLETILLLPGTLCDKLLFESQITDLRDLGKCVVIDTATADNLSELAGQILANAPPKFTLLGLSYGGIIAFEILRQASHRVTKLILLNTNYKAPSQATINNQKRFLEMAKRGEFREITTDNLKDAMLHAKHSKKISIRNTVLQMALNVGIKGFINQITAQLNRPDSTVDLPTIQCPTLIIAGRQDTICPVVLHQEMANLIPNSTLQIIEDCGHLSTLEQPATVNQAIKTWWKMTLNE